MSHLYATLPEALTSAANTPYGIRYIQSQQQESYLSYHDLKQRALGILGTLQAKGIKPGNELIILLQDNEPFIDAFWAGLLGGIPLVSVATGNSDEHRRKVFHIFEQLEQPFLYTSRKIFERLAVFAQNQGLAQQWEHIKNHCFLIEELHELSPGTPHSVQTDDIAFIQYSSGSTGQPKGVTLTHANLLHNIHAIINTAAIKPEDHMMSWMPLTHDMGIIGFHLTPLVCSCQQYLIPTELFVRRPMLWLLKASEHGGTLLSSPNFGYKHTLQRYKPEQSQALDLSSVRLIFNGAEPISVELCKAFMQAFSQHGLSANSMFPVYGLAEASLAVSFSQPGKPLKSLSLERNALNLGYAIQIKAAQENNTTQFVNVGKNIQYCELRIADENHQASPAATIGHIEIRGPNVTQGYYRNPEASQSCINQDGWLDTGDLGFIHEGDLYVTGREKDLIIINGQNYYPQDIENLAEACDGIELGKIAACGIFSKEAATDVLILFVAFKGSNEDFWSLIQPIAQVIGSQTGLEVAHILPVRKLPKTTSGKVQRYQLTKQYLNGEFDTIISTLHDTKKQTIQTIQQGNHLEQEILEICAAVMSDKSFSATDNLFDIGSSSLTLAQIFEQLDERYPDQLDIADLFDHPSVSELAQYIKHKLNSD
ncbi:non-ribosomal peptide synthetase [Candidatus Venteria ishoeyi]|uniref:non-ribosomal peptide synthetase n=1 Tax=Candidatus Venteria ishoeyi TaxID=1899563 RepID=UPI0025A613AB|nr:non-ribosomal peptide synthetase [Candidatus Venteria ishoeyi]MDM8546881.1 non-ribosomal peptide synthetase [Candidatus Venteria ishoeyi]